MDTVELQEQTLSGSLLFQVILVACTLVIFGLVVYSHHNQMVKSMGLLVMASGLTILVQLLLKVILPNHLIYAIDHVKSSKPIKQLGPIRQL